MRSRALLHSVILLLVLCCVATGLSQEKAKTLTPEMVVDLKFVSDVKMDPSGKKIAYILNIPRSPEDKPGKRWTELWVASVDGTTRQFTSSDYRTAMEPEWSPDAQRIAFRSKPVDTDEKIQVYIIPVNGGEATPITDSKSGVRAFRWSPDGKWIAYTATEPKTEEEMKDEKKGRDWNVVDHNYKHHRLWAVEVASGEAHKVIEKDMTVWSFEWSPDSEKIVVQASETPKVDASYMFKDLYSVPVKSGELTLLTKTEGKLGSMAWSPDGKKIAFLGGVDR
nr:hypothetical protein [candidate division KSB1 bacterium]NIR68518.1 hypothetical protein [candidate division KSB1 bacterium]NIS22532.1 hypothetical protein [candidate division KSB1 bacterium]NIT69376.1 hypothetical protein [candidate division KSB1 bacterium]NIU23037.1 hypothetical protein [candidate division KSB1 bacterium]